MRDLRKRFGGMVAMHRRRCGMTQSCLAGLADISVDMVGKIESGSSGARFPVIERLAEALAIDPAELFTVCLVEGAIRRGALHEISAHLAELSEEDLKRALRVLVALAEP
ncbi:helix-turn-helix domain-containing protein [Rhodoblastus sphagnicola]|uniref:helix-turn-helix domain-containing protein n=1 Tax=Rhodoblastus sphagnicola TaxID=333368 RepID=UPI0019D47714|nr:helix-turn-helix transcriptional regulator [Rhodoblastus sphagnicola]